jgi:hypothetical protein
MAQGQGEGAPNPRVVVQQASTAFDHRVHLVGELVSAQQFMAGRTATGPGDGCKLRQQVILYAAKGFKTGQEPLKA